MWAESGGRFAQFLSEKNLSEKGSFFSIMKYLYIVRHGAAQSVYEAGSDFSRRLTAVGCERVEAVAKRLVSEADLVPPQRIIASTAPRAMRTAEILADVFGIGTDRLSLAGELYGGNASDYLDVSVRALPDEVSSSMVVGHNPAVSELLALLTGAGMGEYLMRKGDAACVVFDLADGASWQELYAAEGKLKRYVMASAV